MRYINHVSNLSYTIFLSPTPRPLYIQSFLICRFLFPDLSFAISTRGLRETQLLLEMVDLLTAFVTFFVQKLHAVVNIIEYLTPHDHDTNLNFKRRPYSKLILANHFGRSAQHWLLPQQVAKTVNLRDSNTFRYVA